MVADSARGKRTRSSDLSAPVDFRALFQSVPGLYLVLATDFRIVAVSDAYLRATMTEREKVLGRGIFEVFPDNPEDPNATGVSNLRASLLRALKERRAHTMPVQKYDIRRPAAEGGDFEERFWSPVNAPVIGDDGQVRYLIHRVEDVTESIRLRQAGRELEEMTEMLRSRAEQMESEVYVRSKELERTNSRLRSALEEQARLYEQIALLMDRADRELRDSEAENAVNANYVGQITPEEMLARIDRLIVGHKQLERQLRQAQKMEAVGQLAGGIAHDFNNLLTVIVGFAELHRARFSRQEDLSELDEIERAAEHATSLIQKLLAFSRIQPQRLRVIDLNNVVIGAEQFLRRLIGENIQLVTVLASGLGRVRADAAQIEQVVLNFALNARDAMPEGGRLIIETTAIEVATGEMPRLRPGSYAVIAVKDTGHGMDAETAARIFEPFFSTKAPGKGTGLGLATAYGIAEQSQGAITVESAPGKGATFRLYLPVTPDENGAETDRGPRALQLNSSRTVMVVEDETSVRRFVTAALTAAGYRVLQAANAEEAICQLEQQPELIDLLLTDVVMPGMSGPELVARICQDRYNLMVIYMSGYDRDLIDRATLKPAAGFLEKPFSTAALLSKISELLGCPFPAASADKHIRASVSK